MSIELIFPDIISAHERSWNHKKKSWRCTERSNREAFFKLDDEPIPDEPSVIVLDIKTERETGYSLKKDKPLESCGFMYLEHLSPYFRSICFHPVKEYVERSTGHFRISSDQIFAAEQKARELEERLHTRVIAVRCHYHNNSLDQPSGGDHIEFERRDAFLEYNIEGILCNEYRTLSFFRYHDGALYKIPTLRLDFDQEHHIAVFAYSWRNNVKVETRKN
jgi:hypothetical protein